jgi:hypothetical protein
MKKYLNFLLTAALLSFVTVLTVDAQSNRDFRPDYDYYDDEFDWRWDVRVRISDGINSGLITRSEANRLYNKLENIEEKEYVYAADGFYDSWEQDDVWQDVQWLHDRVGLELRDNDRIYYGFNRVGVAYYGYPTWWYNGGYNFYRFDRSGFGSIRVGYSPQCFVPVWVPNRTVYVNNYRTYGHTYYQNDGRNRVVYNNSRVENTRNTTNAPRTNARSNSAVYNRSYGGRRGEATSVPQNNRNRNETFERSATRGSEVEKNKYERTDPSDRAAATRNSEYSRPTITTERPASVSRSYEGKSESLNNSPSATNDHEYSRPVTPRTESYSPSRSNAGSVESINRPSAVRSTPSTTYSRSSSSGSNVSSSEGRTKLPEARRSSSSNESRSTPTTSVRRRN